MKTAGKKLVSWNAVEVLSLCLKEPPLLSLICEMGKTRQHSFGPEAKTRKLFQHHKELIQVFNHKYLVNRKYLTFLPLYRIEDFLEVNYYAPVY